MSKSDYVPQINDMIDLSMQNFIHSNAEFYSRLAFENITQEDNKESLSRFYIQQKMYQQVVDLVKSPNNEMERYYLGVCYFNLGKFEEAKNSLIEGAKNNRLRLLLQKYEQRTFEEVFFDDRKIKKEPFNVLLKSERMFSPPQKMFNEPETSTLMIPKVSLKKQKDNNDVLFNNMNPQNIFNHKQQTEKPQKTKELKQLELRTENFTGDCVINGAFGFYYLGQIFEKLEKLELASMCYRNSYCIDKRLFSAYLKFTESMAKLEFNNQLSTKDFMKKLSSVEKGKKDASMIKFKQKTALTSKLITYLLQENQTNDFLKKRNSVREDSEVPQKHRQTKKNENYTFSSALKIEDKSEKISTTLMTKFVSKNDDDFCDERQDKKENKNTLKRIKIGKTEKVMHSEVKVCANLGNFIGSGEDVVSFTKNSVFGNSFLNEQKKPGFLENGLKLNEKVQATSQKENNEVLIESDFIETMFAKETKKQIKEKRVSTRLIQKMELNKEKKAPKIENLLSLLKEGVVYQQFNDFPKAKEIFSGLAINDKAFGSFKCSFIILQIAKCWISMMNYEEAARNFEDAHQSNPNVIDGLDFYSSCLWYNKETTKMFELYKNISTSFKDSPIALTIQGNCCSLVKKTDDAISCFKNSIKNDPNNSYTYCLLGHEYVFLEDFKNAKDYYRKALEINSQQFNAHWGLGNIYLQMDDFKTALIYFYNALTFNPYSPLIYSYIGISYLSLNMNKEALINFEKAESFKIDSVMNSYYKSVAYFKLGQDEVGAKVLESLLISVKNEPKIYVLLGKIYNKMGKSDCAHDCFSKAIHLDPRDSQGKIRELLELINATDLNDSKTIQREDFI